PAGVVLLFSFVLMAWATEPRPTFPEVSQLPSRPGLPDPLVMFDGRHVTTREQWFQQRRPELKALFQYYMYGFLPPAPARVEAKVAHQDPHAFSGKATLKEIALSWGPPDSPQIHLLLVVPNHRSGPAPVFVGLNFCGNHALVKDPAVALPTGWIYPGPGVQDNHATEAGRGAQIDVWALEQSIDRGYAVATFYNGDIEPDVAKTSSGIRAYDFQKGLVQPGPHAWGAIAAWAWGLQRAIDYLVTDKDIARDRIAVVGHSRLGKAAIVAAAFDERISLAIPHQAGCGGTSPSRGKVGESVKQINDHFPHWFDATFKEFNDQPDRLPFDQNCLVALAAPRPVLFTNATEDTWSNPEGQFQVLQAADPVYRFLGVGGLEARTMPKPEHLIDSRLGYYLRPGKHSMTRGDWKVFLDYADKYLNSAKADSP
ncbi:MAG: acetylxylan esterase, partial [Planctomycetes bacterium]|nr:acetylxylan esterase [Planctomycetota bacterium]